MDPAKNVAAVALGPARPDPAMIEKQWGVRRLVEHGVERYAFVSPAAERVGALGLVGDGAAAEAEHREVPAAVAVMSGNPRSCNPPR
jgi:hypothetical protein